MDWKEKDKLHKERDERYRELVSGLAEYFPDWTISLEQEGYTHPTMETATGAKVYFRLDVKGDTGGMVRVSGFYPTYNGSSGSRPENRPSVGCNMDRGSEALAKAIKGSFLDHYLRLYVDSLEYCELWRETDRVKMATFQTLVDRFNGQPMTHTIRDGYDPTVIVREGQARAEITVTSRDVKIEADSLTVDQATRMLEALTASP